MCVLCVHQVFFTGDSVCGCQGLLCEVGDHRSRLRVHICRLGCLQKIDLFLNVDLFLYGAVLLQTCAWWLFLLVNATGVSRVFFFELSTQSNVVTGKKYMIFVIIFLFFLP